MAAGDQMRVGNAEREAAAAELQEHFASGRLDQDELNDRLSAAFAAKTRGDLNALFTDLPSTGPSWSDAGKPPHFADNGCCPGGQYAWDAGRRPAPALVGMFFLAPVLMIIAAVSLFGLGDGRPSIILLILAAFALLRRLLFVIFRRRRRGGGRGPRRR